MTDGVEASAPAEGFPQDGMPQGGQPEALISSGEQMVPKKDLDALRSAEQKAKAEAIRQERQAREIAERQLSQLAGQLQVASQRLQDLEWQVQASNLDDDERTNLQLKRAQEEVARLREEQTAARVQMQAEANLRAAIAQYVQDGVPEEELDMSSPQAMKRSADRYKKQQEKETKLEKELAELKALLGGKVQQAEEAGKRKAREELGADAVDLGGPSGAASGEEERLVKALAEAKANHNPTLAMKLSGELQRLRRAQ